MSSRKKGNDWYFGMKAHIGVDAESGVTQGWRFRIFNVIDDVTKECLAAVVDTSISGRRVVRELTARQARPRRPHQSPVIAVETGRLR